MMLATALWLVSPVIPALAQMLGWAALLIVPAIYLHALDPLPPHAQGWQRFWKGIGVVMLLTGAALLLGALAGNGPAAAAGRPARPGVAAEATKLPFERVRTVGRTRYPAGRRPTGKPVMLDFYADWCVSCKEMERFTFADPAVQAKWTVDAAARRTSRRTREEDKALLKRFGLFGPPGIIFFSPGGKEIAGLRVVGYQEAARFLQSIAHAGGN